MKKYIIAAAMLLMIPMGLRAQENVVVDQVVGVVGKHIVKLSDIENSYIQIRIKKGYDKPFENRCEILESMLLTKLLVHKGEIDSIEVKDEEVEQQVNYYLKAVERQYGGRDGLRQATGYSYDEFHDIYFDKLRDHIMSQRAETRLTQYVKVTPTEVIDFFNNIPADSIPMVPEQYELSEIIVYPNVGETERDAAREQLARLRERIVKGEKFSMLATLYSQDPGSAKKGGELGFFSRGDMVPEFEAAAFALKPGEVSPIIETKFGFHIIQLVERRGNMLNARHILITPKVSAEESLKARMLLDSIANQIRLGNITFNDAAEKFSQGSTKDQGGVVYNPYGGNTRIMKDQAAELYPRMSFAAMNAGDITNATPMTSDENKDFYCIMKLTKKIPAHKANLTDDYDNIFNAALADARHKKVTEWAAKMIKNTHVRIAPEFKECDFELPWVKYSK